MSQNPYSTAGPSSVTGNSSGGISVGGGLLSGLNLGSSGVLMLALIGLVGMFIFFRG
jgi:predicted lipid-binding transport protein (Tim44 family)